MAQISIRLEADPDAARIARTVIEEFLDDLIDREVKQDVQLLASELVTNSVRHATLSREDRIILHLSLLPDTVRVEVSDSADRSEIDPGADSPMEQTSGWGFLLVERISDRWRVERAPTSVWFEIDL